MVPVVLLLAALSGRPPAVADLSRVVRSTDSAMSSAVQAAIARSPTIAAMVDRLRRARVIVYVQPIENLPPGVYARTTLISGTSPRYLRIEVLHGCADPQDRQRLALIGHELRHAVEIAEEPSATDGAGVERLYARIGRTTGKWQFESDAAMATQEQVLRELNGVFVSAELVRRSSVYPAR